MSFVHAAASKVTFTLPAKGVPSLDACGIGVKVPRGPPCSRTVTQPIEPTTRFSTGWSAGFETESVPRWGHRTEASCGVRAATICAKWHVEQLRTPLVVARDHFAWRAAIAAGTRALAGC